MSRYIETDFTGSAAIERANAVVQHAPPVVVDVSSKLTTRSCKDGGSVDIERSSATGELGSRPKAGDQALFKLNQCKVASQDIGTLQLSGAIDAFLTEYSGDLAGGAEGHAGMGIVLKNLQIGAEFYPSRNQSFVNVNGEMGLSVDDQAGRFTVSAVASRLDVTVTEGTTQFGSSLFDFKGTISQDHAASAFSLSNSFRAVLNSSTDTSVAGSYTVTTVKPFTGTAIGGAFWWPSSGELTIVAANGSNLTLTAIGGGVVRLAIDENADGNVDSIQDVLWENLVD